MDVSELLGESEPLDVEPLQLRPPLADFTNTAAGKPLEQITAAECIARAHAHHNAILSL